MRSPWGCKGLLLGGGMLATICLTAILTIGFTLLWNEEAPKQAEECAQFRVAFIGNSLTYYNDLPHLVRHLLQRNINTTIGSGTVEVKACLHGGSSLVRTFSEGSREKDAEHIGGHDMVPTIEELLTDECGFDVVVLQDHTQSPAIDASRTLTKEGLATNYTPLLLQNAGVRPSLTILYQTWAYSNTSSVDEVIGDFEEYTEKLEEGYNAYQEVLVEQGLDAIVAPVGRAFQRIKEKDEALWMELYRADYKHPRPPGTFLAGTLISTAIIEHPNFTGMFAGNRVHAKWPAEAKVYIGERPPDKKQLRRMLADAQLRI